MLSVHNRCSAGVARPPDAKVQIEFKCRRIVGYAGRRQNVDAGLIDRIDVPRPPLERLEEIVKQLGAAKVDTHVPQSAADAPRLATPLLIES